MSIAIQPHHNLSKSTAKLYRMWLNKFETNHAPTPQNALLFLDEVHKTHHIQSYIQARAALILYFNETKGEPFNPPAVNHSIKTRPFELNIPDDEILTQLIEQIENKKYQLIFKLSYQTGIRFFDILHLRSGEIDFEQAIFTNIKRGQSHIPPELLSDLRLFAQESQNLSSQYLFRLQVYPHDRAIGRDALRKVLKQAAHELNLTPPDTSVFFIAAIRRFFHEGHTLAEGRKVFGYKLLGSTEALKKLYLETKKHSD